MVTCTVKAVSVDTERRVLTFTVDLPSHTDHVIEVQFLALLTRRVYYRKSTWVDALKAILAEHTVRLEGLPAEGDTLIDAWGGTNSQVTIARAATVTAQMLQNAAEAFKAQLDSLLERDLDKLEERRDTAEQPVTEIA